MRSRGFTLLEVLVAVSILGLSLTVILSSEVGLFSSSQRARNLTLATGLVRCKMSEVELTLLKEGYALIDITDEGPCCEDEDTPGFRCAWKIEKVTLPENAEMMGDGGPSFSSGDGGGPLSALLDLKKNPGALDFDGGLGGLSEAFGEAGVGMDGITSMLMSFVYPTLKPMLEASIRRITVTVSWKEGSTARSLDVVQFVTDPQQGGLDPNAGLVANQIGGAITGMIGGGQQPPGTSTTTPPPTGTSQRGGPTRK